MRKYIIICALLCSINISFADSNKKIILVENISYDQYKKSIQHVETKNAMCTASANPVNGKYDQNITASGYVSYSVTNNSTIEQYYTVDEYMCINAFGCTHIRESLKLGGKMTGNGGADIFTTQYIQSPGTYQDQASIQINGESTCFIQGSNTVHIS